MRFVVLFICLVGVFDIYCTVKYADTLPLLEENLIARSLIYHNGESLPPKGTVCEYRCVDVSRLVAFKCLGLLAANDILRWMVIKNTRWSNLVVYVVALIQAMLLFYLVS